jgi:hypothetical protein
MTTTNILLQQTDPLRPVQSFHHVRNFDLTNEVSDMIEILISSCQSTLPMEFKDWSLIEFQLLIEFHMTTLLKTMPQHMDLHTNTFIITLIINISTIETSVKEDFV